MVKYAVVLAHVEGAAPERVIASTTCDTLAQAEAYADAWQRKHAHRGHTNVCGFYAYGDRVTGARAPHRGSKIRAFAHER